MCTRFESTTVSPSLTPRTRRGITSRRIAPFSGVSKLKLPAGAWPNGPVPIVSDMASRVLRADPYWPESRFWRMVRQDSPLAPRKAVRMAANPISLAPDDEFAELLDDFLASQLSPLTRSSYAGDLTIFLDWLAGRGTHPRDVSRPDVDRYRNWLAELIGPDGKPAANGRARYAPATIARKLSAVRAFYNYLSERRVIPGSPAAGVKGPKLRREPRGRAITDEQVRRLLAVATERGHETEAMVCLLLLNGLRVSEVCAGRRREPASRARRRPLAGRARQGRQGRRRRPQRPHRARRPQDRRRALPGPDLPPPGRPPAARAAPPAPRVPTTARPSTACSASSPRQAGLVGEGDDQVDGVNPHRLRHTFVTLLLDRGVPLAAVQDAARHASSDTTRMYDRSRAAWREHPTHKLDF